MNRLGSTLFAANLFVASVTIAMALTGVVRAADDDWKKEWADTIAKAKGQELVISVHAIDGHAETVQEFQRRFPDIKVQTTVILPSAMSSRVVTEQRNGIYGWDVWWALTGNMIDTVLPAGGLEKLTDYFILPEVKDPSNWRAPQILWASEKGPYAFVHTPFVDSAYYYNPGVIKGLTIDTFEKLLDPRLKGQIVIRNPAQANVGSFALSGMLRQKGPEFVKKLLSDMDVQFLDNPRQISDSVIRGDKALAIGGNGDNFTQCYSAGGCKDIVRLPFSGYAGARGISVFKNAPHKEATKVFVNWILSREGQEAYVRIFSPLNTVGGFSLRKDVEPDPKHIPSVPDYDHLSEYAIMGTDDGSKYLTQVIAIYKAIRDR